MAAGSDHTDRAAMSALVKNAIAKYIKAAFMNQRVKGGNLTMTFVANAYPTGS